MARFLTAPPVMAIVAASLACAPMAAAAAQSGNTASSTQTSQSAASPDSSGNQQAQTSADNSFVKHAIQAGRSEVAEGKLAMKQSFSLAVSEFGRWMVTDHSKIDQFLSHEAQKVGITVPGGMSQTARSSYKSLKNLNGTAFDRQYIDHQVAAHKKAVKLFQQEASSGSNPRLKQSAAQIEPVLKQHLAEAQELQSALPSLSAQKR